MKTREFTTNWWRPEGTRGVNIYREDNQTQVWHIRAGNHRRERETDREWTHLRQTSVKSNTQKKWRNWRIKLKGVKRHERLDVTRKHLKHEHTLDHNTSIKREKQERDLDLGLTTRGDPNTGLLIVLYQKMVAVCVTPGRLSATVFDYDVVEQWKQCLPLMMSDVSIWIFNHVICFSLKTQLLLMSED